MPCFARSKPGTGAPLRLSSLAARAIHPVPGDIAVRRLAVLDELLDRLAGFSNVVGRHRESDFEHESAHLTRLPKKRAVVQCLLSVS